ncbi:MAG TPA: tetratricopeptide repeat protein [Bacteroidetes bacterium]|nr:tetratricopeptide repeat protein [Bacteroidota bacterium]
MKKYYLLTSFLFLFFFASANKQDSLFQQANKAYQEKDFGKATELYEQVLTDGYQSAELEYNLGNAYYRQKNIGNAILHYERALLLSPKDADIQYNLDLARQQLPEQIEPLPEFFLTKWWKTMRMAAPSGIWGTLALLLWWAGLAGLSFWLIGKSREQKKRGFFIGLAALLLSLLPFSLALDRMAFEKNTRLAIVLETTTPLKSAPDKNGSEILELQEGTKVELLDLLSGWWNVELPNGEKGWVVATDVEEI